MIVADTHGLFFQVPWDPKPGPNPKVQEGILVQGAYWLPMRDLLSFFGGTVSCFRVRYVVCNCKYILGPQNISQGISVGPKASTM